MRETRHPVSRSFSNARSSVAACEDECNRLLAALAQISRIAREGTYEGTVTRDAIAEIAAKALLGTDQAAPPAPRGFLDEHARSFDDVATADDDRAIADHFAGGSAGPSNPTSN